MSGKDLNPKDNVIKADYALFYIQNSIEETTL